MATGLCPDRTPLVCFQSPPSSSSGSERKYEERAANGGQGLSPSARRCNQGSAALSIPALPLVLLAAALWAAYINHVDLPSPVPPSAHPSVFSEGRVRSFLNAFTAGVRTLGSCNNELFAPLLMLRYIKDEILGGRRPSSKPAAPDSSQSDCGERSSPSVDPVVVHAFSYYLQATYDPPASFPPFPANRKPPSHQEGALPRMFPPALLSSLSLCSIPLGGSESGHGTLPEHLRRRLSSIEVPQCVSAAHALHVCEGAEHAPTAPRRRTTWSDPTHAALSAAENELGEAWEKPSAAALQAAVESAVDAYDAAVDAGLSASFKHVVNTSHEFDSILGALHPPTTLGTSSAATAAAATSSASVWWAGTPQLRTRCFKVTRHFLASAEAKAILEGGEGSEGSPAYDDAVRNLIVADLSFSSAAAGGAFFHWKDGRHVLYSGLYDLALRLQPLGVLESDKSAKRNALLLSAHADSASGSPGASDDAAMVGSLLEVARNVVHMHLESVEKGQKGANEGRRAGWEGPSSFWKIEAPLIVDINGAEEIGLLGAHGFATLHPFARQVAYALNLESAGRGGKENLIQTSGPHGTRIVSHYQSAASSPSASSLVMDVGDMGLFPGETDLRVWRDVLHVKGGIEFAWTTDGFYYHTKYDDIHHIRPGAIQRVGDLARALTLRLTQDLATQGDEEGKGESARVEKSAGGEGAHVWADNARDGGASQGDSSTRSSESGAASTSFSLFETMPKTSWPRSSQFFADVLGSVLLVFPLRFFEVLLVALGALLVAQVRLERSVLGLTFSLPLLLLSVGSLLLALIAPLVLTAVLSQATSFLLFPLITFWDWRLGAALYATLGAAAFLGAWYRLLFKGLFVRFPASRHPFKAEQAALHGAIGFSLLLLCVLRYSGARAAFAPLLFLLLASASRVLTLSLLHEPRCAAPGEEAGGGRSPNRAATAKATTVEHREDECPNACGTCGKTPTCKALMLCAAHCAFLLLPTIALLQTALLLSNTMAPVLGRVNSVWGLGDSFAFTVSVLPFLIFLLPLLVSPALFFSLHHSAAEVGDPSQGPPPRRTASPRRRTRRSVMSLWILLGAVGAALVALGVVFVHRDLPEEELADGEALGTARETPAVESPGVFAPDSTRVTRALSAWQMQAAAQLRRLGIFSAGKTGTDEETLFPYSKATPLRIEVRLFSRKTVRGFTEEGADEGVLALEGTDGKAEKVGVLIRGISPSGRVMDPTSHATARVVAALRAAVSVALRKGEGGGGTGNLDGDAEALLWPRFISEEKFVHFENLPAEETVKLMMRFPQVPVAMNTGHAISLFFSSREGKAPRSAEDDAEGFFPPHLLLPPRPVAGQSTQDPSLPSPIFLQPTMAALSSRYNLTTDQTQLHIRIGGASLFSLLLPASPIVGWSLDKTMSLERTRDCDCFRITVFAPHPPAFAEFSLTLKGKSGLTFSSTSSLMDPLEPVAGCREASLFAAALSPEAFTSPPPPQEHRKASASRRRQRAKARTDSRGQGPPHIVFWEELERRLPAYVVGTYYAAEHIQWEIPAPPFDGRFYG
ncbi:peptidase, M28 family protein [Besnoitia besnoiti]|uniref:Vacuolar membrane protease n=1 Tax=Besnoitia besnoiti TaxID=94643 RepID=A0A2A9MB26_BESBE|nr:peptidase, M28 family protein [Besnoitia besnoiti]PFH35185.1 peptidase, M28 family protein [Besnoitia besnoiti]